MLYYLYRHIRLDKNEPFYIGIGRKRITRKFESYSHEYERAFVKFRPNLIWQRIVNKTPYEIETMFETDIYELILNKEREFISLYGRLDNKTGSLANLTDGGEGILNVSKETRTKISKKLIGIKRSDKTKEKIRRANLGKRVVHSDETKFKISQKNSGSKNGMFAKHGVNNKKSKPINQYDLNNVYIRTWVNAREIHKMLNICYKQISDNCNKKQKTCHGYIWKYV